MFGLLWLLFTKKLEKIKGGLTNQDLSVYGSQTMTNAGKIFH
jgi:hypothetical protein